jgi:hypothetical protein
MKHKLEQEAMHAFLNEMLGGEGCRDARERISSLWEVSRFCSLLFVKSWLREDYVGIRSEGDARGETRQGSG